MDQTTEDQVLNGTKTVELPRFEEDVDIIQKLDDEPNDTGGLTAQELKERFDRGSGLIKAYLNGDLVPALETAMNETDQEVRAAVLTGAQSAETAAQRAQTATQSAEAAAQSAETAVQSAETAQTVSQAMEARVRALEDTRTPPNIYGVEWTQAQPSTAWKRTDDAAWFADPKPYIAGATEYGSPFDHLYPWCQMRRVSDPEAGELVAIPKFWCKWTATETKLKLQIADGPVAGFGLSPAHRDRGDGKGERDVVYVGRYHSGADYRSVTGAMPIHAITMSTALAGISAVADDVWICDYAMRATIQMLYLVEFSDWDSQKKIGRGCGNNKGPTNVGATDNMPYHTGTMASSREECGCNVQYRFIEGLWDNVFDWLGGAGYVGYEREDGKTWYKLAVGMDPASYIDGGGNGVPVGIAYPNAPGLEEELPMWPTRFTVSDVAGFDWVFYPVEYTNDMYAVDPFWESYMSDLWMIDWDPTGVYAGGGFYTNDVLSGMFCIYSYPFDEWGGYYQNCIGCRLQKLP